MRGSTAKRINTTMKNAEATNTKETAAVAEQGAQVAPEKAASKKAASQKKGAPKANKGAKKATKQAKAAPKKQAKEKVASKKAAKVKEAKVPREFSKKSIVLDLLRRPKGATMAEIAKATDWQNHSIRGFISGNLTKKMGLTVESTKNEAGERTYRIAEEGSGPPAPPHWRRPNDPLPISPLDLQCSALPFLVRSGLRSVRVSQRKGTDHQIRHGHLMNQAPANATATNGSIRCP